MSAARSCAPACTERAAGCADDAAARRPRAFMVKTTGVRATADLCAWAKAHLGAPCLHQYTHLAPVFTGLAVVCTEAGLARMFRAHSTADGISMVDFAEVPAVARKLDHVVPW